MNLVRTSTKRKCKNRYRTHEKKVRSEYNNWNEDYITGNHSRVDEAEDQIRNLEVKEAENTQSG